uniref:Odorant receptor n=1 Tax=Lutzomyia longipalpis TaxID=7200 RepID=A0A7G3AEX8_LUTLO
MEKIVENFDEYYSVFFNIATFYFAFKQQWWKNLTTFCFLVVEIFTVVTSFYDIYYHFGDPSGSDSFLFGIILGSAICQIIAKQIYSNFHRDKMLNLLEWAKTFETRHFDPLIDMVVSQKLLAARKFTIIAVVIYMSLFTLAGSMYSCVFIVRGVEGKYWLVIPYLSKDNEYFNLITVTGHVIVFIFIGTCYGLSDTPSFITGLHLMGFLDAMKCAIRLMKDATYAEEYPKILRQIHLLHLEIIMKLNEFNYLIYIIALTQFLSSMVLLAFMISLIIVTPNEFMMYYCGVLIIIQLFIFCIFGEILTVKTENITEELYQINWYEFSIAEQKKLLLILQISQRNYAIKAGGMYPINIYAFIQVSL